MVSDARLYAYPRIHFGLVDLGRVTPRSYGGAGAAVCAHAVTTTVSLADEFELRFDAVKEVRQQILSAVKSAGIEGLDTRAIVTIENPLPAHVGFGSGTIAVLSTLAAVSKVREWPVLESDLVRLSGRGRTSGVGCRTFFHGGFAVDVGQREHPPDGKYRPSHDQYGRPPSTSLGSWAVPDSWRVSFVYPSLVPTIKQSIESSFFRENTPVSANDVRHQIVNLYHGLLPALIEGDLAAFGASLRGYQCRGFKQAEIRVQPPAVRRVVASAWDRGLAAGLSSFGPIVFIIHSAETHIGQLGIDLTGFSIDGPFKFQNEGARWESVEHD
jgi:beta-ribofuranosylaminobenzene 5'-phosphate synthase